jgi:signal transduction histidine kinase
LGALVAEIDRQFAPVAQSRELRWESRADAAEFAVVTDASRCQQIFGNLVANAIRYTANGGWVRVVGSADADSWSISVADSGPGIPHDAIERVFEPFFRLDRDEHSPVDGSGLGLAICRELVAQLHGKISLNSTLGRGTSISVRFPLATVAAGRSNVHCELNLPARRDPPSAHRDPTDRSRKPADATQRSLVLESMVPSATGSHRSRPL